MAAAAAGLRPVRADGAPPLYRVEPGPCVGGKLHRLVLDKLGARGELDWSRCAIDSVNMRAMKGGT
ncbi:transposase [Streptomyces azureus]|uniref:Transposase n=1 Tax=Streptomyces azureus TaxID=146537 RepID=A0A0K8PI20_STRAJ|nr:transposase [Streptomyces azureus]